MQQIEFIGNLTGNPETKQAKTNTVCVFTVAVNDGDNTDFFRVNAWNKLGENCQKYLTKGKKVFVKGKLKARLYESKGKTYMSLDVQAQEVEFLSPRQSESATVSNGAITDDFTDINSADLPF